MKKLLLFKLTLTLILTISQEQEPKLILPFGHTGFISSISFASDGRYILTGGDNTLILWDLQNGKEIKSFDDYDGNKRDVSYSHKGQYAALASDDSTIKLWDADINTECEITVLELRKYVSRSAQDLTNGLQKPTMRQENIEFDFSVW